MPKVTVRVRSATSAAFESGKAAVLGLLRLGFPAHRRGDPVLHRGGGTRANEGRRPGVGSPCRGASPAPWVSSTQRSSRTTVSTAGAVLLVSLCLPGLFALAETSAEPSRVALLPCPLVDLVAGGRLVLSPRRPGAPRLVHVAHGAPVLARRTRCVTCC